MKKVWKYQMADPGVEVFHNIPSGAELVAFMVRDAPPYGSALFEAWFLVDTTQPDALRKFKIYPTGQEFDGDYRATVRHGDSLTVWHLVEE